MRPVQLSSTDKVIDRIGGLRLQAITGATSQSVSNWRSNGRFPPRYLLIMLVELIRIGCSARLELWGIEVPRRLRPLVSIGFSAWAVWSHPDPEAEQERRAS